MEAREHQQTQNSAPDMWVTTMTSGFDDLLTIMHDVYVGRWYSVSEFDSDTRILSVKPWREQAMRIGHTMKRTLC